MSLLRSAAKSLMGTVFTLSLISLLIVQNLVALTGYDNFKSLFSQVAASFAPKELQNISISQGQLDQVREGLKSRCINTETIDLRNISSQFNVDTRSLPIDLSSMRCSDLDRIIPSNVSSLSVSGLMSGLLFDSVYYRNYSCDFIGCMMNARSQADYMVIVSSAFNSFLSRAVNYLMLSTAVSLALFILLGETLAGRIKGVGWSLFSIGIIPFVFGPLQSIILQRVPLPAEAQGNVGGIVRTLGDSLFGNFPAVLAVGIVLLVLGYGLGLVAKKRRKEGDKDSKPQPM